MPILFTNRRLHAGFIVAALLIFVLYAGLGQLKPASAWKPLDVVGEGGVALLTAGWLWIVLASRPAGRVTLLLACGLAGVALGAWCDCLDEFFVMAPTQRVDNWLESTLPPLGMAVLTAGLLGWRREQFQLSEHMEQRERLFRDHRAFDRITELAHADYLREQLDAERSRRPGRPAALLMVEATGLADVVREHGRRDGVRALRAVTHQLLLNLRTGDLLCRYAGDRFLVLLPETTPAEAERRLAHLSRMVRWMAFHPRDASERAAIGLRGAAVDAGSGSADELLARLDESLEPAQATPTEASAA